MHNPVSNRMPSISIAVTMLLPPPPHLFSMQSSSLQNQHLISTHPAIKLSKMSEDCQSVTSVVHHKKQQVVLFSPTHQQQDENS